MKVIKDGKDLETVTTTADGKFIFGELNSGKYELSAEGPLGFKTFRSLIEVRNPEKKCRRELVIVLAPLYPDNCGSYVEKH